MFPIAAVLAPIIGKVIDRIIPDPALAAKAKTDAMQMMANEHMAELQAASKVIVAEAKSESWLARNWRPITMLTFVFMIANNYVIMPYMQLFGVPAVQLEIHPDMWGLIKLGLSGYIVGRTVEKVAPGFIASRFGRK